MNKLVRNTTALTGISATIADVIDQPVTRHIDTLVVHVTATPEGREVSVAQITDWHTARGFNTIGYHFLIHLDGRVERGRDLNRIGAHVKGHNRNSAGIAFVGGLDVTGAPKDTRTAAQKAAAHELLAALAQRFPVNRIMGHRDFSPDLNGDGRIEPFEFIKACPCFDAIPEYADILANPGTVTAEIGGGDDEVAIGLRPGSIGPQVAALQDLLGLPVTGNFDKETADAVIEAKIKLELYPSPIVPPYVMRLFKEQQ